MSTKVDDNCPNCNASTSPIDYPVVYKDDVDFSVKLWRYKCGCGWIWANDLQRKHNSHAYYKARKLRNARHEYF